MSRGARRFGVAVVACLGALPLGGAHLTARAQPPGLGGMVKTNFFDHAARMNQAGLTDPSWYEDNVPFLDLPDTTIQNVYYYRWYTWREHLNYLGYADGYTSSEFLNDVGYNAPGGTIDAAAGHVIHDGRWARDPRYLDDYQRYWMTGPGAGNTHGAYTFWAASSYYDQIGRAHV